MSPCLQASPIHGTGPGIPDLYIWWLPGWHFSQTAPLISEMATLQDTPRLEEAAGVASYLLFRLTIQEISAAE